MRDFNCFSILAANDLGLSMHQVAYAASHWCGEKLSRWDSVDYFMNNWWALPGLKQYVKDFYGLS